MTRVRSLLFWCHLIAGAAAGVVILIMSATGTALALKPQILNLIDRDVKNVRWDGGARLPISQVLAAAQAARPGAAPISVAVERDPSRAVAVTFERGGTLYVNPYTAAVIGEGSVTTPAFFRTLENWHRWIGLSAPENRALAKSITGASNLAFLFLGVSGLFLWWPHSWTPGHTRAILMFRRNATGRARDFNWHNVMGFWCAPVIIVMTATATVISYPWATDLLYRAVGSTPPSANREARPAERAASEVNSRPRMSERTALTAAQIDWSWSQAEGHLPTWGMISLRTQNGGGPFTFTLTDGAHWNAFARSQLTVNPATTTVQRWQPYAEQSLGQKARGWFRFAHTGELAGLPGQIVAGIGCAGGVVLVWTGLSLALRRFFSWRLRKVVAGSRTRVAAGDPQPAS